MTFLCIVFCVGISIGPLWGITRENSTFGEVVRKGDSARKRWFRFRLHIQRPSEIAFFYENRSGFLTRNDGLIRWGASGFFLTTLFLICHGLFVWAAAEQINRVAMGWGWYLSYDLFCIEFTIFGFAIVMAAFIFLHGRNTIFQKVVFFGSRKIVVGPTDTKAFITFLIFSTLVTLAMPIVIEVFIANPNDVSILYASGGYRRIDFVRVAVEGPAVMSLAGLTIYSALRYACLFTWVKTGAFLIVASAYFFLICLMPLLLAAMVTEIPAVRDSEVLATILPPISLISPMTTIGFLFNELGSRFPRTTPTICFYIAHGLLILVLVRRIRKRRAIVESEYRDATSFTETVNATVAETTQPADRAEAIE